MRFVHKKIFDGFIVKVSPEASFCIDAVLTVFTQTGDSLSRGWMPRDGERCGDLLNVY